MHVYRKVLFPGFFFYVDEESPNPKTSRKPHTIGPKLQQLKTPTAENHTSEPP